MSEIGPKKDIMIRAHVLGDRNMATIVTKLIFYALTALFLAVCFYGLYLLIIPFGIAFLLAFLLNPMLNYFQRLGLSRLLSIAIVLPLVIFVIYWVFYIFFEPLTSGLGAEALEFDTKRMDTLKGKVLFFLHDTFDGYFKITDTQLDENIQTVKASMKASLKAYSQELIAGIPTLITYILITPLLTFIFLVQGNRIYKSLTGLVPNRYFEMTILLVSRTRRQIYAYMQGLIIQMLILSVILSTGWGAAGVPFGIHLGILAAIFNLIPYAGPLLGVIPPLALALLSFGPMPSDATLAPFLPADLQLWGLVLIIWGIAQLVDNLITQPMVLSKSVQLHPVITVLALFTAGSLFGVAGLLVAIPFAAILLTSIQLIHKHLKAFNVL